MTASSSFSSTPEQSPALRFKAVSFEGPAREKAELISHLVSWFSAQGLKPAVCHWSPHLDPGDEGKDTWRYRQAGSRMVALVAPGLWQIVQISDDSDASPLFQILASLKPYADLVLVEGFKDNPLPQVVITEPFSQPVYNPETIALVSPKPLAAPVPVFHPGEIAALGRFILQCLDLSNDKPTENKDKG